MENQKEESKTKTTGQKIKFGAISAILIIVGLFVGYVLGVVGYVEVIGPYISKMKYKAFLEDYLKLYKEDFVGGDTPEETIDLFIEALRKGDYELASKYFILGEQKTQEKDFKESKRENIEKWIIELEDNKGKWRKEQQGDNKFVIKYNTGNGESEITNFIILKKNVNNKWKIGSF